MKALVAMLLAAVLSSGVTIAWERKHDLYHFEPTRCGSPRGAGWATFQPTPDGVTVRCEPAE